MAPTQPQSHLPTPITKPGSKASMKKLGNNTMATTKTQSQIPTPITKPGLSYGKNVIATIKYH
jgi:hypothetical protein